MYLDQLDFLIASVDLSYNSFLIYCERAFEIFFDNPTHSISTPSLVDILLQDHLPKDMINEFVTVVDDDQSGTVDYAELFETFIEQLGIQGVDIEKINNHLSLRYNKRDKEQRFTPKKSN